MSSSEIAFLVIGLILGAAVGAAIGEVLRARPAPRRQVRVTISPNSVRPRRSATLSDPEAAAGRDPGLDARDDDASGFADPGLRRTAASAAGDQRSVGAPAGPEPRTRVPSPVSVPSSAIGVPVTREPGVPVGPGEPPVPVDPRAERPAGPGASGRTAATALATPARDQSVAVLDAPRHVAGTVVVAPLPSSLEVGVTVPGLAVRTRAPGTLPRATVTAVAAPVPVMRPRARLPRRAVDEPPGGTAAGSASAADPCAAPRNLVDERCALASAAHDNARTAAEALRDAQRAYDVLREHLDRAEAAADPREVAAAKDELHRRFRDESDLAGDAEAAEAAARAWLQAINELNDRARDAAQFIEDGRAELLAAQPRIARLALESDAARIRAEGAEASCREARERLAACEEAQVHAAAADPSPVPSSDEPHPFDALWPGEADSTRTQPLGARDDAPDEGTGLPLIILVLRGDRDARDRLVAALSAGDAEAARMWQLRLSALVDAITARAIEDGYLDLPDDHTFWGPFGFTERREIVAALSALGYRFDGLRSFADGRVPTARDLALAVGYAGLDRMRIRSWPREGEAAALFERATVASDEWLAERADDLSLGQMVDALGSRAGDLADLWNAWGRVRPVLLSDG